MLGAEDITLSFMLGAAQRADDYQTVSDVARALLGNPELRAACLDRNAANVARVRALVATRREPCDDTCPGWCLMNVTERPEIQVCIECFPGAGGPTDDDVGGLPEAQAALAQYQRTPGTTEPEPLIGWRGQVPGGAAGDQAPAFCLNCSDGRDCHTSVIIPSTVGVDIPADRCCDGCGVPFSEFTSFVED